MSSSGAAQSAVNLREAWHFDSVQSLLRVPRSLTTAGQCDVWVADHQAGLWRIPCAGGTPELVGAMGHGSGEYQEPWTVTTVGHDSVALFDRAAQQVNIYTTAGPRGVFVASKPLRLAEAAYGQVAAMSYGGGALRLWMHQFPSATNPEGLKSLILRPAVGGEIRDTLVALDGLTSVYWGSSFGGSHVAVPLQRRPVVAFLRDGGFVVGHNDSDHIVVYDAAGHEIRTLSIALPVAAAVSKTDRDAYTDSIRKITDQDMETLHYNGPERKQYRTQIDTYLKEDVVFPDKRQRYDGLVVDASEQSLWVLLSANGKSYSRTWQVYSLVDGSLKRRVTVPHRGAVVDVAVRDGALYAIELPLGGFARVAKYGQ